MINNLRVDVLICGGGPSGMAAAVNAARQGAKVLLVERYGRLGGMAANAIVGPIMGEVKSKFVEEVEKYFGGDMADFEKIDMQYATLVQNAGADILLHSWAMEAVMNGKTITGVKFLTKQGIITINAKVVIDATGDGDIALSSGAAFEIGRPGDGLLQPVSIMYKIDGVHPENALYCRGERQARVLNLPAGTWEEVTLKALTNGELPENVGAVRMYKAQRPTQAIINATQINRIDGTNPFDLTKAEFEGRKQAYIILEFLKKHAPGYENAYISSMPAVIGVRETRRFLGIEYLDRKDLVTGRKWPDAVVWGAKFVIDIHNPDGAGQAEGREGGVHQGAAEQVQPYDIPYGCLVPREIDGLLLTGRCISGSHAAHASYRVQRIMLAVGAAAGAAAAVAIKHKVKPRNINVAEVQKILA